MNFPWRAREALPAKTYHRGRRQAIFQYHKWDQQVGDVATFCPWPLIVEHDTWRQLTSWTEALAAETQAIETELLSRPELHSRLGLRGPKNYQFLTHPRRQMRVVAHRESNRKNRPKTSLS